VNNSFAHTSSSILRVTEASHPDFPPGVAAGRAARFVKSLGLLAALGGKRPALLSFNVSNRCNERCPMCSVWQTPAEELSLAEMEPILADLRRSGIRLVEITGGEPFLRGDLPEIFNLLDRLGFLYSVTTNGTLWRDDMLRAIGRAKGIVQLAVSLDSLIPQTYSLLRGRDLLGDVMANVERLAAARLPVPLKINLAMGALNREETFSLLAFARDRRIYLSVFPMNLGANRMHSDEGVGFGPSDVERARMAGIFRELACLRRRGEPLWEYSGFYEGAADYLLGRPIGPCGAGRQFLDLHADGKLAVCLERTAVADLRRESIAAVPARIAAEKGAVAACAAETPCCYTCTLNVSLTARHRLAFLRETLWVRIRHWWRKRGQKGVAVAKD